MRGEGRIRLAVDVLLRKVHMIEQRHEMIERQFEFIQNHCMKLNELYGECREAESQLHRDVDAFLLNVDDLVKSRQKSKERELEATERRYGKIIKRLEAEIKESKAPALQLERRKSEKEEIDVAKAKTLAIFDSIIFAISNWSVDGQTAPDIELLLQSQLFPSVYERVMMGYVPYYFDKVPIGALEVVRRGREYVKSFREKADTFITESDLWYDCGEEFYTWLLNDALPLLYGEKDDDWDKDKPVGLDQMIIWRDQPASRALKFPAIWDGMELIKSHSEEIREQSGLPEFNKQQLTTRLEP